MSALNARLALLLTSLAVVAACGGLTSRVPCSPSSCPTGCCTSEGVCVEGTAPEACGGLGLACTPCAGAQACALGSCVSRGDGGACPGRTFTRSGAIDYDLKVVKLSGRVTLSGASAPSGAPRGTLTFERVNASPASVALSTGGEASYQLALFAGTYKVTFSKGGDCRPEALPCGTQVLHAAIPIEASGVLDLDLKPGPGTPLTVSGRVTRNGADPAGGARGGVRFTSGGSAFTAPIASTGVASWSVQLPPGTYDVFVDPPPGCVEGGPMPCIGVKVLAAQPLMQSGALDLATQVVTLTGAINVNGQPMAPSPDGLSRGRLKVTGDFSSTQLPLSATGAATWSVQLHRGTYKLELLQRASSCAAGPLPCSDRILFPAHLAHSSGVLDAELKVVALSGKLSVNGQAISGLTHANLSFDAGPTGTVARPSLGPTGAWSALLYADTYDIELSHPTCTDNVLPCGSRSLKIGQGVTATGVLDLDVAVATLNVTLTANGMAIPNGTASTRGTVAFSDGKSSTKVLVPGTGPATFSQLLFPGSYEVSIGNPTCAPPLPCGTRPLSASFAVQGSASISWDLPVVSLSGQVTMNGQLLPSTPGAARGQVRFLPVGSTEPTVLEISRDGAATWSGALYAGVYAIAVRGLGCNGAGLPCVDYLAETHRPLLTSGLLDFDVPTVTLSGSVTLNGQPFPASPRGALIFQTADGGSVAAPVSSGGAATWSATVPHGEYRVSFSNASDCTAATVPCQTVALEGCL